MIQRFKKQYDVNEIADMIIKTQPMTGSIEKCFSLKSVYDKKNNDKTI